MTIQKFKKKPIVIEAIQLFPETFNEVCEWIGWHNLDDGTSFEEGYLGIETEEGTMQARTKDWIIKGVNGEFYPCKPDIFEKTYEPVTPTL